MQCLKCKATHGLHSRAYMDRHGMNVVDFMWAPNEQLRELRDLENTIREQKSELATYLEKQHGIRWINHFEGRTKKAIWAELTDNGQAYPQLSTFYNHVRGGGLDRVLKSYLRYEGIEAVTRILQLDDAVLASRTRQVRDLARKLDAKNNQTCKSGFR